MSQTVVITGASAGIGRAIARRYADRGARIGLIARGDEGLDGAVADVEARGGEALRLQLDVGDADAVEKAAEEVEGRFGPIDVWVNNAMATVFAPVKELTADEVRKVTETTYLGYVHGTLSALKRMLPRDHGVIVQVGSALSYRAIPLQAAYCGAKHAIKGFTESLRCELLHDGSAVQVVMVQLPAVNTPQFDVQRAKLPNAPQPVPPILQPEPIAKAIVWAADHPSREVLVGTNTVLTVLGQKFVPRVLDHYLAATGFESQQTEEELPQDREGNLFEPVEGDHGAHGSFDERADSSSVTIDLMTSAPARIVLSAGDAVGRLVGAVAKRRS